jgi:stage II sporulation protein R
MITIILIFIVTIIIINGNNSNIDEMIRIRVIANSNSEYDQKVKMSVSDEISKNLYNLLKDENNINKARKIIKSNLANIDVIVNNLLTNEKYSYNINYGMNEFPEKEYNGKIYKEGKYESLLVTLGQGNGDNWWCILFPPLCLIEAKDEEKNETIEYKSFFKEIIDKIF